ncbi:MAG TPA: YbhB/YbcL family Raf kinase inhibitor-like protein, partial [Jatrophihabitantaceae bacterium]
AWGLDPAQPELAEGQRAPIEGKNGFGSRGYRGPCPPKGAAHRYVFTVYALDQRLRLAAGAAARELRKAVHGHALAQGSLTGRYGRQGHNSELYDFPAFANTPGVAPLPGWLQSDPFGSQPADKLALLADAQQWSTNVGHPGPANAAIGEIFNTNVLPTMMANAARGKTSPKDAVVSAHNQCEQIFAKWRKQGLVGGSA